MRNQKENPTVVVAPRKFHIEARVTHIIISHLDISGPQTFTNFDPSTLLKNCCPGEEEIRLLIGVNEDGQPKQSPGEFIARAIFKTLRVAWNLEPQEQQGLMSSIAGHCQTLAARGQTPESILQLYCQHLELLSRQFLGGRINPEEPGPNNQKRESASAFFARLFEKACEGRPEIGRTNPVETYPHPLGLPTRMGAKFPPGPNVELPVESVEELPEE